MQKLTRLKAELAMLTKNPPPGIHCWPDEENTDVIYADILGPIGSPYEKGTFRAIVTLSAKYPFDPPSVQFMTPIYHPNIDPNGRICLGALKPKPSGTWTPLLNIPTILAAIRVLLSEPNLSDALMVDIAKQYSDDYPGFIAQAEAETLKHAVKSGSSGRRYSDTTTETTLDFGANDEDKLMETDENDDLNLNPMEDPENEIAADADVVVETERDNFDSQDPDCSLMPQHGSPTPSPPSKRIKLADLDEDLAEKGEEDDDDEDSQQLNYFDEETPGKNRMETAKGQLDSDDDDFQ